MYFQFFVLLFSIEYVASIVDITRDFSDTCIEAHNIKRRLHGADDLYYSEELSSHAESAANQSSVIGQMVLPEDFKYGQNIAYSTKKRSCEEVVELWYKTSEKYSFRNPMFQSDTGAFTQLIWKESTRIACSQRSKNEREWYTVCIYDPPGNVKSSTDFHKNVSPARKAIKNPEEETNTIEAKPGGTVKDLTNSQFQRNCLQAHNKVRRLHGVENLVFDEQLLEYIRKKVLKSASIGKFDPPTDYGENSIYRTRPITCDYAVNRWYDQKKFYDFELPMYHEEATGFMQLVWKSTAKMACATAQSKNGAHFLACAYDPIGLIRGQFKENIVQVGSSVASTLLEPRRAYQIITTPASAIVDSEYDVEFYGVSLFRHGAG